MKYAAISLLLVSSLAACAPAISNERIIKNTQPDLIKYDKKTQEATAIEMEKYCAETKLMCMMIGDYGTIRDQIRVAIGEKVDVTR